MSRLPQKARFECPSCGSFQLEPYNLISTYCRACGDYYEVGAKAPAKQVPFPSSSSGKRSVLCYRCEKKHHVSPRSVNTLCPWCNSAIELGDMEILSPVSRQVDIRGELRIGSAGSLSSSWIVCGSADIEGVIVGRLRSEGEVHMETSGVCACKIEAPSVIIGRKARASFTLPLETGHLEVRGHLTGIVHCRGIVHVCRGGRLEAEVYARSVKVDKGGALLGTCHVDGAQPEEPGNQLSTSPQSTLWPELLCPTC